MWSVSAGVSCIAELYSHFPATGGTVMSYVAVCLCGWNDELEDQQSAEVSALYHEEVAGKLQPHKHQTYTHREDE